MCQPGPAVAPGRLPPGVLALLARLPEREVLRRLLQLGGVVALALLHLLERAVRELAVAGEGRHAEVDVAAALVRVVRFDERLDQGDDLADRLGGLRLVVRAAEAEAVGVLHVRGGHLARELRARHAALAGGVVDLVVHVGDVDHERACRSPRARESASAARRRRTGARCPRGCARRPSGRRRRCRCGRARAARRERPRRSACPGCAAGARAGGYSGDRRPTVRPAQLALELRGEREQRGLLAVAAHELHADRQAVVARGRPGTEIDGWPVRFHSTANGIGLRHAEERAHGAEPLPLAGSHRRHARSPA